ncbi:MAG: DUF2779 domain-containing protein [Oscillatoriales cyanobacterium SM2_2_1]|nr:DUF2779 domain-containing protein [Oscillatoriales cyanobacterium SM2_2_1]
MYLTKSDFKVAQTCPTKLYYRKLGFTQEQSLDPYTKLLSEGGFMVQKMAQVLFPQGIEIQVVDRDWAAAAAQTLAYLQQPEVTLFEAVVLSRQKLARVDILHKIGDRLELIEVKSRSFDSREHQRHPVQRSKKTHRVNSEWRPTIEDVAFQIQVLQEALAAAGMALTVEAFLMLPDRTKTTDIDRLPTLFELRSDGQNTQVLFHGDVEQLRQQHILTRIGIHKDVLEVLPGVAAQADFLAESLQGELRKIPQPISKHCRNCEYPQGFATCWGELAAVEPHVLDFYQVGRLGSPQKPLVNDLIAAGTVSMFDIPVAVLDDLTYGDRQLVQWEYTAKNQEWFSEHLPHLLKQYAYPLYFIDFETSRLAMPYHAGMRPYEQVAFQWSCHILPEPGAAPQHIDWINVTDAFPNFAFARALMERLPQSHQPGTIFTWATHENSVLRDIYFQMQTYGHRDLELQTWLEQTVKLHPRGGRSRLVDMNALTLKHYFHPLMKGRTSLKYVLPAIWTTQPYLHRLSWLQSYYVEKDGAAINPYDTLPTIRIADQERVVAEGTAAMLAYQEMLYGQHRRDRQIRQQWLELLRQYCCLDTMAMVIIWWHWWHRCVAKG